MIFIKKLTECLKFICMLGYGRGMTGKQYLACAVPYQGGHVISHVTVQY